MVSDNEMKEYPECEKLRCMHSERMVIQQFLEWLSEQGFEIAKYSDVNDQLCATYISIDKMIMDYLEIDTVKLERERRAMLESVSSPN